VGGVPYETPFGNYFGLKVDKKLIVIPKLTQLTMENSCLPHFLEFLTHIKATNLKHLKIKVPLQLRADWSEDKFSILGPNLNFNNNELKEEVNNKSMQNDEILVEVCLRYLCRGLGTDAEGEVHFPNLYSCEVELLTLRPASYESEQVERILLDMLKLRSERGAVPMRLNVVSFGQTIFLQEVAHFSARE